jgi:hypothetical protein
MFISIAVSLERLVDIRIYSEEILGDTLTTKRRESVVFFAHISLMVLLVVEFNITRLGTIKKEKDYYK